MKKLTLSLFVACLSVLGRTQTPGEWTWMSGSNNNNTTNFGTQGIPSISNTPNYSYESRKWIDDQGNFWLYGGLDISNGFTLCDLWRFNPVTNEWTWMKGNGLADQQPIFGVQGVASSTVNPGICNLGNSASWKDLQNNLWLLESNNATNTCILWKYDLALNEWAWISGNTPANYGTQGIGSALNNPEPFFESPVSWTDDEGDLWFLDGYNGGVMWEYDIASNQWTWMNGAPSSFNSGVFTPKNLGNLGVFSATNTPGSGWYYTHWKANDGTFYLFGGNSYLSNDEYSAMCQFDPATNQWAWVGGFLISNIDTTASFVDECVFDPNNFPLSTLENTACWVDECGRLWAYENYESYLWCYDPAIKQFSLVDGDVFAGVQPSPVYGTQGISSPLNDPGAATGASTWADANGNLWRLGSLDANSPSVFTNTLWRYTINPNCLTVNAVATAAPLTGCASLNVTFTASPLSSTFDYQWDFGVPNLTTDTSSLQNPTYVYTSAGTYTAQLVVSGNLGCNGAVNDTASITIVITDPPVVTVNSDSICVGESVLLTANGATTYTWSPATGLSATTGTEVVASPTVTTVYTVTGNTAGCSETTTSTVTVFGQPVASIFASPNPTSTVESTVTIQTSSNNSVNSTNWYLDDSLISQLNSFAYTFPNEPGSYVVQLIVTNALGCSDTGYVTIVVQEDIIFYVPNSFTPNDDDFNNIFIPIITSGIDTKNYAFNIFNRWGELIFETNEIGVGWDGTYKGVKVQDGTYTWTLKFKSKYNDGIFEHTGHVNLNR